MASHSQPFNPNTDIPSLTGKVIVITGGYSGLGKQSALELVKHNPAQIWIAGRDATKAGAALSAANGLASTVPVHFLELDLASFKSIRNAADTILSAITRLDILVLNAGVMNCPPGLTYDGYETHFGTNHMGHALFLRLLTPLLLKTSSDTPHPDVRVVIVSSDGHKHSVSGGIQFDTLRTRAENLSAISRYAQSKLANVLYAREIARRYPQWTTVSVHPGAVKTELHRPGGDSLIIRAFQKLVLPFVGVSVEEGVLNHLWAATAKDVVSGEYYEPVGISGKASPLLANVELGKKLWEWTDEELQGRD